MTKDTELMLDLFLKSIYKERDIYRTYLEVRDHVQNPKKKEMLTELAQEERKHRKLMLREFRTLREMMQQTEEGKVQLSEQKVSYHLPQRLIFKELDSVPGIDLAGISLPSEFMGGDYLESFPFYYDDQSHAGLGLLLGDIMGHGMMVVQRKAHIKALFSNAMHSIHPKNRKDKALSTAAMIHRFNEELYGPCQKSRSFLTLFLCLLDPDNGRLIYTSAGHNPGLLFTEHGARHTLLANSGLIIGVMKDVDYNETEMRLGKGDILMLYTDGITEATNKKGKEFGLQRLIQLVQQHHNLSAQEIINRISTSLSGFIGKKPLHDDLTLTIAKIM